MIADNPYTLSPAAVNDLRKHQSTALIVGIVGMLAMVVGFFLTEHGQFMRSYLVGFMFWTGTAMGCLALMMIQYMSGGAWGMMIRRSLEAGSRTIPLMMLLVIPILAGVTVLYPWAFPGADHLKAVHDKRLYLNVPFFVARAILFFGVWCLLMFLLNRWSLEQDRTGDINLARKLEKLSGPGIVIYAFTMTFAVTDWVMSLDPTWFSTVYGLLLCVGQCLSALATIVAVLILMADKPPLAGLITKRHLHDLGKLMLALTMLWAYLSFSQLILIWSGNLPEEISYYINRLNGGWEWVGGILLAFHFGFPFLLLLSQALKKNPKTLRIIACYIIVIRIVDVFWLVEPNFNKAHFQLHWLDLAAPIGIGGLWFSYFFYQLRQRPILPVNAPDLEKALNHGRHH
ncbi:MAG: hypothetical protein JWO80_956 [Bryobacterales bacterium]|nr:hypothetical protein [Bryobacterales bacterium]